MPMEERVGERRHVEIVPTFDPQPHYRLGESKQMSGYFSCAAFFCRCNAQPTKTTTSGTGTRYGTNPSINRGAVLSTIRIVTSLVERLSKAVLKPRTPHAAAKLVAPQISRSVPPSLKLRRTGWSNGSPPLSEPWKLEFRSHRVPALRGEGI